MNVQTTIVLVDDHALMLDTLAGSLNGESGFEVIGVAANAEEAINLAHKRKPDVMIFDIDMPGLSPFEAAGSIARQFPDVRIIFLSAHSKDYYIQEALSHGASAYISKSEPYEKVVEAIRAVARGDAYFSQEVQSRIVVGDVGATLARVNTLTPREREVLTYLAKGMSKKEVGRTMHVSVNTVDVHTSHIMTKLDIHDRVDLARFAIREGLADA